MTTLKDVMTRSEPTSEPTSKPLNKIIFIADSPPTQNIVTQLGQFNKMIVFVKFNYFFCFFCLFGLFYFIFYNNPIHYLSKISYRLQQPY